MTAAKVGFWCISALSGYNSQLCSRELVFLIISSHSFLQLASTLNQASKRSYDTKYSFGCVFLSSRKRLLTASSLILPGRSSEIFGSSLTSLERNSIVWLFPKHCFRTTKTSRSKIWLHAAHSRSSEIISLIQTSRPFLPNKVRNRNYYMRQGVRLRMHPAR